MRSRFVALQRILRSLLTAFSHYVLVFLIVTLVLPTCSSAEPSRRQPAANSALGPVGTIWGGEHLALEVTADGANVEFDCATGTISGSLVPDAQGKFAIKGTLVRERPGPTIPGGNPTAQANYSGRLQGEMLHLVVSVEGSKEPYGKYVLTRGKPGRVLKCQ